MSTIAWAILMVNLNYGEISYANQVRFATKEACEQALAFVAEVNSKYKTIRYTCAQVVVPPLITKQ